MAPSIFRVGSSSSSGERNGISLFEIRLNQNPIVLRGHENEAPGALLSGTLVLCLSTAMHIRNVHMTLRGEKQAGWFVDQKSGGMIKETEHFFQHRWDFFPPAPTLGDTIEKGNFPRSFGDTVARGKLPRVFGETVKKGNYTWNFELEVPGNWSESIEGSLDTFVIYRLKATIDRGTFLSNIEVRKPLRVIRTPNPSFLDLCQPASVEEAWPDKLEYSISTPTKGVVFGSPIKVDVKVVPFVKGLTIESISSSLIEDRVVQFARSHLKNRSHRVVARDEWIRSDDMEMETIEIDGHYGHIVHRSVQVPTSLTRCLQSVDTKGIEIKHGICCDLRLRNPDGHRSKVHTKLSVFIYISPYLAPDDDDTVDSALNANPAITDVLNATVPPQYGAHQLDQLYSEVDSLGYVTPAGYLTPAGYVTPAGYLTPAGNVTPAGYVAPAGDSSGLNTPFASHSRSTSVDDLVSMSGIPRGWVANILQIRLQPLSVTSDPDHGYLRPLSDRENSMRREGSSTSTIDAPLTAATSLIAATPWTVAASSAIATPSAVTAPSIGATPSAVSSSSTIVTPSVVATSSATATPSAVPTSSAVATPSPLETPLEAATPLVAETISAVSRAPIVNTPPAGNSPSLNQTSSTSTTPQMASSSAAANALPTGAVSTSTPSYATPQHIEFSTTALSKVPSYRTARNTRPPVLIRDGLPNYESAVQAPIVVPVGSQPMPNDPRAPDEPPNPAP